MAKRAQIQTKCSQQQFHSVRGHARLSLLVAVDVVQQHNTLVEQERFMEAPVGATAAVTIHTDMQGGVNAPRSTGHKHKFGCHLVKFGKLFNPTSSTPKESLKDPGILWPQCLY
jgi:hypothetical protein